MTPELIHDVASYLDAPSLLELQSVTDVTHKEALWQDLCANRWESWPAFRLTDSKRREYNQDTDTTWQERYLAIEIEANRTTLTEEDLLDHDWNIRFVISMILGLEEEETEQLPVQFERVNGSVEIAVDPYPPHVLEIHSSTPPDKPVGVPKGDRPFSETQWIEIGDYPILFVTRNANAEWLLTNEHVLIESCSSSAS